MLATYLARQDADDWLSNLEVGELPEPSLRPGWALIRMQAASVNHHDLWTLRGVSSTAITTPHILGCDVAGVIEAYADENVPGGCPAVGSRVIAHAVISCSHCPACRAGDKHLCRSVYLLSEGEYPGTFAELVQVPSDNLVALPDSVDTVEAGCLPTSYLTAYRMLFTKGGLSPGDVVLIHGATGGVATAAVLLAKCAGITIAVTSRHADKRDFALKLGADVAVSPDRDGQHTLRAFTDGVGVDAVIDTVGEPTWDFSLRAVRAGGAVVVAGATGGGNPPADLARIFWRHISILGTTMGTKEELIKVVALCANGTLHPLVDRTFALAAAGDALRTLANGEQRGKLVIVADNH